MAEWPYVISYCIQFHVVDRLAESCFFKLFASSSKGFKVWFDTFLADMYFGWLEPDCLFLLWVYEPSPLLFNIFLSVMIRLKNWLVHRCYFRLSHTRVQVASSVTRVGGLTTQAWGAHLLAIPDFFQMERNSRYSLPSPTHDKLTCGSWNPGSQKGPKRVIYFVVVATWGEAVSRQTLYEKLVVIFGIISVGFFLLFKNLKGLS